MKQILDNKKIYEIYKEQFGENDAKRPFFTYEQFLTLLKQLQFNSVNLEEGMTLPNYCIDLSRAADKCSDTFSEISFRTGNVFARIMKNSIGGRKYFDFFRFNIMQVTESGVYNLNISPDYSTYYMETYKNPVNGSIAFISNEDIDYLAKTYEMSRSNFILKKYPRMNYNLMGLVIKKLMK